MIAKGIFSIRVCSFGSPYLIVYLKLRSIANVPETLSRKKLGHLVHRYFRRTISSLCHSDTFRFLLLVLSGQTLVSFKPVIGWFFLEAFADTLFILLLSQPKGCLKADSKIMADADQKSSKILLLVCFTRLFSITNFLRTRKKIELRNLVLTLQPLD